MPLCVNSHPMVPAGAGFRCEVCARAKHEEIKAIRRRSLQGNSAKLFPPIPPLSPEDERIAARNAELQALMDGAPLALVPPAIQEAIAKTQAAHDAEDAVLARIVPFSDPQKFYPEPEPDDGEAEKRRNTVAAAISAQQEMTEMATAEKCPKCGHPMEPNREGNMTCPMFRTHPRTKRNGDRPAKAVNLEVDKPKAVRRKKKPAPVTEISRSSATTPEGKVLWTDTDPDPLVAACARLIEAERERKSAEAALRDLLG